MKLIEIINAENMDEVPPYLLFSSFQEEELSYAYNGYTEFNEFYQTNYQRVVNCFKPISRIFNITLDVNENG